MRINVQKMTLAVIALSATAIVAAACSSSKKSSTPTTLNPATKPDGTTPSALACVGSNTDPASVNSNINMIIHTVSQPLSGSFPDLPGTRVAVYSVATGTTSGTAMVTNSASNGVLQVKDSTRTAFALSHDPNGTTIFVPTFQFNTLTPTVASAGTAVFPMRMIPQTIYNAFLGLIGAPAAVTTGKVQLAATVVDCDGDAVVHAVIDGIPQCTNSSTSTCVAYFQGSAPNPAATETDASGTFVVLGLPAGSQTTVHLKAVPSAGVAAEEIGHLSANGAADTVALGTAVPSTGGI